MTNPTRAEIEKLIDKELYGHYSHVYIKENYLPIITHLLTQIDALREVFGECDEAMGYMSEYDIPLCLPDRVKQALAQTEHLAKR
jgi:hypothetical protein